MKRNEPLKKTVARFGIVLAVLAGVHTTFAQSTAFTYQGRLVDNGNLPTGTYDVLFKLWDSAVGGAQIAATINNPALSTVNGLFTQPLDYGGLTSFPGADRWLEISVRTNGSVGPYTVLIPRQKLTPEPYSIHAYDADSLGGLSAGSYAPATGSGVYVAKAGDTMTGALNLPANGLNVGSGQLVAAGGDVGVGTSSPKAQLHALQPSEGGFPTVDYYTAAILGEGANGVIGFTPIGAGFGVFGYATNTSAYGVYGSSIGGGGVGVYGNGTLYGGEFSSSATGLYASGNPAIDASGNVYVFGTVGIGTAIAQQALSVTSGLNVDQANLNAGFLNNGSGTGNGITFGSSSGEGIASQRTAGVDQFSLEFYTGYSNRLTIMNSGLVGINTTSANGQLDVEGTTLKANGIYVTTPSVNGNGIYAAANNGANAFGVWGYSSSGIGVVGQTSAATGTGVSAEGSGPSSTALSISSGSIRVAGAGIGTATPAFIHVTSAANIVSLNGSRIDNALCNGDPNAILLVTHNLSASANTYHDHALGVYYDGIGWQIFNEDSAAMPTNIAFNVLIIKN